MGTNWYIDDVEMYPKLHQAIVTNGENIETVQNLLWEDGPGSCVNEQFFGIMEIFCFIFCLSLN